VDPAPQKVTFGGAMMSFVIITLFVKVTSKISPASSKP